MAITFSDLHTEAGLKALEQHLSNNTYISGEQISKDDIKVFGSVLHKPGHGFPNASRWYANVHLLLAPSLCIMGTQMLWDGTLSPDEFCVAAKTFCEKWKQSDSTLPTWNWISRKGRQINASCNGYLSLENIFQIGKNKHDVTELRLSEEEEEEESTDSATLVMSPTQERHGYTYHIVYSFSYRVPVLYFRGFRCDGQLLTLDQIESDLPDYSASRLKESKWTFMTQEEHPFLCCPWYTLHPCGTSDWMKLLFGANQQVDCKLVNYLPAWLSVVGQAVGLRVPLNLHDPSFKEYDALPIINDGSTCQP